MAEIFKKLKVEATGLGDLVAAGVLKSIEERTLSGVIGNGSFTSGAIKAFIAMALNGNSKIRKIGALAFGVDAGEDIAYALLGKINAFGGNTQTERGDF